MSKVSVTSRRLDGVAERMRGRAGVAARIRRVQAHPLCAECALSGIVEPTWQIDHIQPLALGGTDTDDNVQGLCEAHHAAKSALEVAGHQAGAAFPGWLMPSRVPLAIIAGPPGAGKSTWVAAHQRAGDLVIDLDAIICRITGRQGHQRGDAHLGRAIRARNVMLADLSRSSVPAAWFITSAPTKAEQDWWATTLAATAVKVLDPGSAVAMTRVVERGTPWLTDAVARWYRDHALGHWSPPKAKPAIPATRADGLGEGGAW